MSGEWWACEACLPRGGLGVLPQKCLERVSALRLILVGFGNQALVIARVPVNCLQSQVQVTVVIGTGDHYLSTAVLLHV